MRFWLEDHNRDKTIENAGDLADVYVLKIGSLFEKSFKQLNYKKFRYGNGKVKPYENLKMQQRRWSLMERI